MAYALFEKDSNENVITVKFETPNADDTRDRRAKIIKTRPPSNGPKDTRTEVTKLELMLNHISSDCEYPKYRDLIWAIESLN